MLALLALGFCLGALELGLRAYVAGDKRPLLPSAQDDPHGILQYSRVLHHDLQPLNTFLITRPDDGTSIQIRTNSFGLRGPEIAVPKPPGVFRILCLGDERTLALCSEEAETFCYRLEELLRTRADVEIEVINAGVPGYCPLLSFLQARHSLLSLQPDLFVLNFDMSDVADDYRCRGSAIVSDTGVPLACPHPSFSAPVASAPQRFFDRYALPRWCLNRLGQFDTTAEKTVGLQDIGTTRQQYAWLKDNPPDWSIYIKQTLSAVDHLQTLVTHTFGRIVVATHPVPWQVSSTASSGGGLRAQYGVGQNSRYQSRAPFEILAAYMQARGIPFCDASPEFEQFEDPSRLFLRCAPQFSRLGHELYARTLAEFIVRHVPGIWRDNGSEAPLRTPYRPEVSAPHWQQRR
jgi:hypothetical protein